MIAAKEFTRMKAAAPANSKAWAPEPNGVGHYAGRVYSTAINVLTLEVYYRYRPVFTVRKS